jgi:hypothetical protein
MLTSVPTYLDWPSAPGFSPGDVPLSSLMPVTGELRGRCPFDRPAVTWLVAGAGECGR